MINNVIIAFLLYIYSVYCFPDFYMIFYVDKISLLYLSVYIFYIFLRLGKYLTNPQIVLRYRNNKKIIMRYIIKIICFIVALIIPLIFNYKLDLYVLLYYVFIIEIYIILLFLFLILLLYFQEHVALVIVAVIHLMYYFYVHLLTKIYPQNTMEIIIWLTIMSIIISIQLFVYNYISENIDTVNVIVNNIKNMISASSRYIVFGLTLIISDQYLIGYGFNFYNFNLIANIELEELINFFFVMLYWLLPKLIIILSLLQIIDLMINQMYPYLFLRVQSFEEYLLYVLKQIIKLLVRFLSVVIVIELIINNQFEFIGTITIFLKYVMVCLCYTIIKTKFKNYEYLKFIILILLSVLLFSALFVKFTILKVILLQSSNIISFIFYVLIDVLLIIIIKYKNRSMLL